MGRDGDFCSPDHGEAHQSLLKPGPLNTPKRRVFGSLFTFSFLGSVVPLFLEPQGEFQKAP